MADDNGACLLMSLPLEVRHTIFEYSAARDVKPKKLLRYWFERKEAKELVAKQAAADPSAPAARVVHNNEYEEDSDVPEPEDDDGSDGEGEEENESENEDEDEDEDEAENEDEDEDEAEDEIIEDADEDEDEETADGEGIVQSHTTSLPLPSQPPAAAAAQDQSGNAHQQSGEAEDDEDDDQDDQDGDEAIQDGDGDEAMAQENEDDAEDVEQANATAAAPPLPVPVVHTSRKWRYIPNFMRITHCPPPVELLLASKQLNQEAKDWFYDVAVLRINATGSFAHTSFFEEAFSQITEAAFSPMENVRKVEATFAWDTTWLRAEETGCAQAIFPALLRQRSDFVYKASAPCMKCFRDSC
jgi:hypothetical protein